MTKTIILTDDMETPPLGELLDETKTFLVDPPRRSRPDIEIHMDHYAPPQFRWVATFGGYDLDCDYGQGATPLDAVRELLDSVDG